MLKRLTRLGRLGPLGAAMTLGQLAWVLRNHWLALPVGDRDRLAALVRKAKGRPSNLTGSERDELRQLVRRLQLVRLFRRAAADIALARRLRPPA